MGIRLYVDTATNGLGMVHEVNVTREGHSEAQGWTDLQIFHFADNTKSRGNYLPLLLEDIEENPNNDRNCYYRSS